VTWSCRPPIIGPPNLGEIVLGYLHEEVGFGYGLLALRAVEVHLVAVEVRVVWCADGGVQPEGVIRQDPDPVAHHRYPVQGRLPVEDDYVAVGEHPLDQVAGRQELRYGLLRVREYPLAASGGYHVVGAGIVFAACQDEAPHPLEVAFVDLLRDGELHGHVGRDPDLVDGYLRVRADDGTRREVDPLPRQVIPEPALLALQPLGYGLERPA